MENQNTTTGPSFRAEILTPPSKTMVKNNAGKSEYVIYNAQILADGPMKGFTVTGAFTIKNAQGERKTAPNKGDIVTLYADVVNGKPLFEIGSERVETTSDADILGALAGLGIQSQAGQTV